MSGAVDSDDISPWEDRDEASPFVPITYLTDLEKGIAERLASPADGSYVTEQVTRGNMAIFAKIVANAQTLERAASRPPIPSNYPPAMVYYSADIIYDTMIAMAQSGISWNDVLQVMEKRTRLKPYRLASDLATLRI